ncbi:AMP phosphorylase [Candidatus Micrarchaeota archaeon]|nr:AMP phosphorylase [Candidatus Micrarchaeota archaeon]
MDFKVHVIDVEAGLNVVVLDDDDAKMLDVGVSDRVKIKFGKNEAVALVDLARKGKHGEAMLFSDTAAKIGVSEEDTISVEAAQRPASLDYVRKKLDGGILADAEVKAIITDLMNEELSAAELAAFIAGVYTRGMNTEEVAALTNAIYETGDKLEFKNGPVVSEHSIGGVAGDRVSMIIVPTMASLGIKIPKTCTRAISSASGTADTLEVLCPVSLSMDQIKEVVTKTNGCLVWGGAVNMAVADDKLIKIRHPLRLDPEELLLSSILAKKKAEGAKTVLLDIPCGRGSKVENIEKARELAHKFQTMGSHLEMQVDCIISDGTEPVMNYIGPALEAREVLRTLEGASSGLLAEKACLMSGVLLHMVRGISKEEGYRIARYELSSGKALAKFKEIIGAQGGDPKIKSEDIKPGKFSSVVKATAEGRVHHIDNKSISRVCRAAGAPADKGAGMVLKVSVGQQIKEGAELYELCSSSKEKLDFALQQAKHFEVVEVEQIILDII